MELLRLLASIRRHRVPIAFITATIAVLGALLAANQAPTYEVTSRIVLGPDEDIVEANDRIQVGQVLNHPVMAANLSEIITSDRVLSDAQWVTAARDPDMEAIDVTALIAPESNVIEVVVSGPERSLVVGLVEPITAESVVLFEEIYPVFRAEIIDLSPEPEVREPVPPLLGAMIGAFVGVVLAIFVALFIDAVRRPARDLIERSATPARRSQPALAVVNSDDEGHRDDVDLREARRRRTRRTPPHPAGPKPRARVEPAATDDPGPIEGLRQ